MSTRQPILSCYPSTSRPGLAPVITGLTIKPLDNSQRGIALAMGLLFLLLLTIIGVTSMNTSILQERMAGNMRDQDIALQAAETSLRYGEELLRQIPPDTLCNSPPITGPAPDSNGVWGNGSTNIDDPAWWSSWGITLMQDGSTKQVVEASEDPRHVFERITYISDSKNILDPDAYGKLPSRKFFFRISARGVGRTSTSQAVLRNSHLVLCP